MLDILYNFVTPWAKANKLQILVNRLLGKVANVIYPIWCKSKPISPGDRVNDGRECEIIVSLTSYPARIEKVALCVQSILRQSMSANRVILWLAEEQFPDHNLPFELSQLVSDKFEIRYCDDLRSYKKIFYTAQEFCDAIIITADDDTLYPENWLAGLYETSLEYQNMIVCYRAHEIVLDGCGCPVEYVLWNDLSPDMKGPSNNLVAIGVGGILYPRGFFEDVDFNYEIIKKLCPSTDDLWLKAIEMLKDIPVVKVCTNSKEWFTINDTQMTRLTASNVGENVNDKSFRALMDYYQLKFDNKG